MSTTTSTSSNCRPWGSPTPSPSMSAVDRSVAAAWGRKLGGKQWERWCTAHDWVNRAAEHDSDLASRRRERMAKELDRAKDDAVVLIRAALAKVAERIQGMDAEELAAGQIPAALRTLIELEFKALGYEDRVALTGKDGGPVKTEITGKDGGPVKTDHIFQPSKQWLGLYAYEECPDLFYGGLHFSCIATCRL